MRQQTKSSDISYIESLYAQETDLMLYAKNRAAELNADFMCVTANEGRLLQLLIKLIGAKKIVEVGTLSGCSALWMAEVLPEDGMIYTIERDFRHIERAFEVFNKYHRGHQIKLYGGEAADRLSDIAGHAPFDMIFIDGQKTSYLDFLDWSEINIRKNGLIVADNTLLFGGVYGDARSDSVTDDRIRIMNEFNQRLADSQKYFTHLFPTSEGLTVAIKLF